MVIDNYESIHLNDVEVMDAIKELSKRPEYAKVSKWVSVLGKNGNLIDVVRKN